MRRALRGRVFIRGEWAEDTTITFADGLIQSVEPGGGPEAVAIDGVIVPGFIDLHVHGAAGSDFMDGTSQAVETIARYHAGNGTTALAATTLSASHADIIRAIGAIAMTASASPASAAEIVAVHLEGPWINPMRKGAQDPASLRSPDIGEAEEFLAAAPHLRWIMTIAPELEGVHPLIERFKDRVLFSVGHSDASFGTTLAAFEWGARHVTHLFNAMSPMHHREPGVAGAALISEQVSAELIADGIHIHPAVLRYFSSALRGRACLVTDAIRACGMPPGIYELYGHGVTVDEGGARLPDGTLAGSVLTMMDAVRNMVELAGLPLEMALPMATEVPARILGLSDRKGRIEPGMDADLVVITPDLRISRTFVRGQEVHPA